MDPDLVTLDMYIIGSHGSGSGSSSFKTDHLKFLNIFVHFFQFLILLVSVLDLKLLMTDQDLDHQIENQEFWIQILL